ncbi:DUF1273 domain-containing protein [Cytobacillus sp. OWB-43]|uniref:DUF1273 domain-containing protein n=1 Tax=Cytobacillus sp. OWB-43 TaxID=3108468 RepID=UPI002AFE1A4A|nr:DUF1273 domain-containing protein [Cytobacillus sp. OWB-43]MEA1852839.1 DUF1273 domain-containing protein [Cytobacillus sp. OWB-43]
MVKVTTVSGYKPFELGIFKKDEQAVTYIKRAIKKQLLSLLDEGLEWVLISGQLGTELWAAEVVYELQEEGFEHLQLGVITPFLNVEGNWKEDNKEWYESIVASADYVDAVSRKPYENPNQFKMKNIFHLSKSDCLILFYDTEKEGSPKYLFEEALNYQNKKNYSIHQISFYDIQLIVEEDQMTQSGF